MLILLDALLLDARRPIELIWEVGNTQAITAVHKGYSKKLQYFERTHMCSIGHVHELYSLDSSASITFRRLRADEIVLPSA